VKNILFFFLLVYLFVTNGNAQQDSVQSAYQVQEYKGKAILVGRVSEEDIWRHIPGWRTRYVSTLPDTEVVEQLKKIDRPYKIVCVLGIWCPDSEDRVPPFLKALDAAQNPNLEVELYGVDRRKNDPHHSSEKYRAERVPTFILFSGGKEIGRMIERPQKSFPEDFLELVKAAESGTPAVREQPKQKENKQGTF